MDAEGRAVVLGAGGPVGTAWMIGLAAGLREHGIDLGEADLIVGTSAGAIVGALLATGQDLGPLGTIRPSSNGMPPPDPGRMGEVFALLGDPALDPGVKRQRVGSLAITSPVPEQAQLAQMEGLIAAREWPTRRLLVNAVDCETGLRQVWDRESGAAFIPAVTSSMAFPGAAPAITVNGRRYMDGGMWSGTNSDLADGVRTVVLIEPVSWNSAVEEGRVTIRPDVEFGADLYDMGKWAAIHQAGQRQASTLAERLRDAWMG